MTKCTHCGHEMRDEAVKFCSNCGAALHVEVAEPSPFAQRLQQETKPDRKYQLIQAVLAENPDDFEANEALLFLGRLHEKRRGRALDFSIIKCHLLCIYDEPEKLSADAYDEKHHELFEGEQLMRTMALAKSPGAFFKAYLERMAREYIDLFIRGDSRYATWGFGFSRSMDSLAKTCAEPVRRMIARVQDDERLDDERRALLERAVADGFAGVFAGHRVEG